jgi:fatty-acyl-CoA synthase
MITKCPATYRTLVDAVRAAPMDEVFATMWQPDREPENESVTYGQFLELASHYAAIYHARGLKNRDTVVLVMAQGIPLMAAFTGALLVGVIPTILAYPTFKIDPEKYRQGLTGVTRNLAARLVVLDDNFPDELAACIGGIETERLDPARSSIPPEPVAWATPQPRDIAFIQHSSGTTGLQKGVSLPHDSVLNQLSSLAEALDIRRDDRIISWLPLYHDMGLIACFILPLVTHLPIIMQSPSDWVLWPASFLRLASEHRGTLCWLPNFAFQFLARRVRSEDCLGLDLSSLRGVINCSEPVRAASMEEFYQAYHSFGLARTALQSSYAMAENTFAVTQSTLDGQSSPKTLLVDRELLAARQQVVVVDRTSPAAFPLVSSGPCISGNELQIVDVDGRVLPEGTVGEILIRSNSMFSGYCHRPDLSAEVLRNGWYRTGDLGLMWQRELFVLGRQDDMIIVAGKNLYPQDVEEIVFDHPEVHAGRVVAFGIFNQELGTQDLVIVAEMNREECLARAPEIQYDIRQRVMAELSVAPKLVHLVPPKWIVKSTAGKPARSTNKMKFLKEHPEIETEHLLRKEK